jgi:hypothetical protein
MVGGDEDGFPGREEEVEVGVCKIHVDERARTMGEKMSILRGPRMRAQLILWA